MPEQDNICETYETEGGVRISRTKVATPYDNAVQSYVDRLDYRRGAVLSSNYEYPGRYTRWDTGIIDPPVGLTSNGRNVWIEAFNDRGLLLLDAIESVTRSHKDVAEFSREPKRIDLVVRTPEGIISEEQRSRAPSVFSILRAIVSLFKSDEDSNIGLYGAFGYDLTFQFDPIDFVLQRPDDQRDLVLYLPDEILVVDHHSAEAWHYRYDFEFEGKSTEGLDRGGEDVPFVPASKDPGKGDHEPGKYADLVRRAMEKFKRGDLFEVVPGQVFYEKCDNPPSEIAKRLKQINPSPYSFFFNLGNSEYLVGASPEMFVRVSGRRIETCPISGTIKRGDDPIADSEQVLKLLNSKKDESELTMCSDVDRNDKSRVCEPGSVKVIGRRQIEMYSKLIHTVDHIEGRLLEGMDAFDGFLSHAWAVTVTGAPKLWAMRFIEENEKSPRAWYGGAVGLVNFNGDMNTGLTIRTVRIKDGIAEVRAGATLLFDSDPEEEEKETELKASAMRAAIKGTTRGNTSGRLRDVASVGKGVNILLVDHEDSFVHTLANYFRQTGAKVTTMRSPIDESVFDELKPDLVVLSPGPGQPVDFDCKNTIAKVRARNIPLFGVCLGLQAITDAWGGELRQLAVPVHGKPSRIRVNDQGKVFSGLANHITVGRYHSIFADPATLSKEFIITAETEDGIIMGIEHKSEPVAAVQFHPESIMTLGGEAGHRMIENVVALLAK